MEETKWTHEWLDATDALSNGDANLLLALMLKNEKMPLALRDKLINILESGKFAFILKQLSAGRPKGNTKEFGLEESLDFFHVKEYLRANKKIKLVEFELILNEQYDVSQTYIRKALKTGKEIVASLVNNGHEYSAPTWEELSKKYPQLFEQF